MEKGVTMGREYGRKDMVFCLFYCHKSENNKTPFVLAHMRDDGRLGFPGGNMERKHRTIFDTLKDEVREEINFTELDVEKLELMTTSINTRRHITTFSYEMSFEELKKIQLDSINAEHYLIENMGTILLPITKKTLNELVLNNFTGNSKNDLKMLVYKKGLLR